MRIEHDDSVKKYCCDKLFSKLDDRYYIQHHYSDAFRISVKELGKSSLAEDNKN